MSVTNSTKKVQKTTGLRKCFSALVDRKQVQLDMVVLNLILKKELQINMDALDERLAEMLPIMLVRYMKNWPGWQRSREYFSGKLNFKQWYEKFRQYIVVRLNYLVKNGYNNVLEDMKRERKDASGNVYKATTEHGSQTDALAPKGFAPYDIRINCPRSFVNSIIFSDFEDDIIIGQHPYILWNDITTEQLIHWPDIEIEFLSPQLSFRRRNCFEFDRYISFVNTPLKYDKPDFIDRVEIINPLTERTCYTLKLLQSYVKQYLSILRSIKDIDINVNNVEMILEAFLTDIQEIGINDTIATNTSVVYNIGKRVFIRNKKMSKSNYKVLGTVIGYTEIIIPKVETSLYFFKDEQDLKASDVSFVGLNRIRKHMELETSSFVMNIIKPMIKYKCGYCSVDLKSELEVMHHLKQEHKMDPNVSCLRCKQSLPVNHLANVRWKHECSDRPVTTQSCNKI